VTREEWEKRYRQRFAERARTPEGNTLSNEFLDDIAGAVPFEGKSDCYEDDPEGAADEEMSYWED
jgi:hypothetical protein